MHLFIGGACAGKRAAVSERFPTARWHRLAAGESLDAWRATALTDNPLVMTGWEGWLEATLAAEPDDERVRARLAATLDELLSRERTAGPPVVMILPEMGRGVVPMAPVARRLRDLAGWLAQDATARCDSVWYVRHGLVQRLRRVGV